ncbi:MAG: tRNA (guanosine(46)-N7)-methyltransferase TrmB [Magnetospirillum sp. WYHS-4]
MSEASDRLNWYGRRQGHKLKPGRARLVDTLLPRLRVPVPAGGGVLDPAGLFSRPLADLWFEVGFGGGEHLAEQAKAHPDIGFIGCEPFVNGVASLLHLIDEGDLDNVRLLDDDARPLLTALPEASIGRLFVLFPDPWPKRRHHRRRFVSPPNLDLMARVLKDGAELRFASDHMDYVRWTLFHAGRHPAFEWTAERPDDWRRRPADGFPTRYEAKALTGSACLYLSFRRKTRGYSS